MPQPHFLPMIFNSGDENTFLLYMIIYENLEQYRKAYKLYDHVQEEIDDIEFEEEQIENSEESDDNDDGFALELQRSIALYD